MKKNIRWYSWYSLLRVSPSLSFTCFFRSILENWTLFSTAIIGSRSLQVLQVLLHYEYHWQLVQVLCLHKFIYVYYFYSDRYVSTFVFDHTPVLSSPTFRKLHAVWLPLFGFRLFLRWWDGYMLYLQALTQLSLILVWTQSRDKQYRPCFLFSIYILIIHPLMAKWQYFFLSSWDLNLKTTRFFYFLGLILPSRLFLRATFHQMRDLDFCCDFEYY